MQEFTVSTTNYDVEFGQVAGAVAMMTTRSGTNQIHGSANWDNRVNSLFARNSFTEPNGPGHFVFNQYGGTLGGPVNKNKLFLFGHYQGVRVRSGGNILATVPIEPFRRGDFSSLPQNPIFDPLTGGPGGVGRTQFPNNMIPANRISPVAKNCWRWFRSQTTEPARILMLRPEYAADQPEPRNDPGDYVLNDANRYSSVTRIGSRPDIFCPSIWNGGMAERVCRRWNEQQPVFRLHPRDPAQPACSKADSAGSGANGKQDAVDQDSSNTSTDWDYPVSMMHVPFAGLTGFRIGGPVGAFNVGNNDHAHQVDNYGGYNYVGIVTWTKGGHIIKFGADINFTWRDRETQVRKGISDASTAAYATAMDSRNR